MFIWNAGQFRLDHTFDTQQATDIAFLSLGPYLIVTSETAGLSVLTRADNGDFVSTVTLSLQGPVQVETLALGRDTTSSVIVVTNRQGPAQAFLFAENTDTPLEIMVIRVMMYVRMCEYCFTAIACCRRYPCPMLDLSIPSLPALESLSW